MTDKLELKSCHEVIDTVDAADVESIFYCKPTDPDILTVLMKDGKRLYCDEVCPIDSLEEEPSKFDAAIQEGDDVRYNEDLGCRVNLSQLKRVAKKEESVSDELEEACEQLAENERKHKAETQSPFFSQTDYKQGVIDGAQWQKQKMMKDAVECDVLNDGKDLLTTETWEEMSDYLRKIGAKAGDKVKLKIIKE